MGVGLREVDSVAYAINLVGIKTSADVKLLNKTQEPLCA